MSRPIPIQLDDPDNPIGCAFFQVEPPEHKNGPILIAKFTGCYRPGCQGNPDAAYIVALGTAGVSYWEPKGVVLDLSQLEYVWGDMMDMVRGGGWAGYNVPFAVVVGEKCRDAMATLMFGIDTRQHATEAEGYFENLDAAIDYVTRRLQNLKTPLLRLWPPRGPLTGLADVPPMTESQWLESQNPREMLDWITWGSCSTGMWTDDWNNITPELERKLLLFAVACVRRIGSALTDQRSRRAVDVAERVANGQASEQERAAATAEASEAYTALIESRDRDRSTAAFAALHVYDIGSTECTTRRVAAALGRKDEHIAHANLIREIFGNPFVR